ncbi:hypothetical protein ES703_85801 [subsurface metagenome]
MELDLPGGVVRARVEVGVEEVGVQVGWGVPALELAPAGSVSVLIVAQNCRIKWEHPAMI